MTTSTPCSTSILGVQPIYLERLPAAQRAITYQTTMGRSSRALFRRSLAADGPHRHKPSMPIPLSTSFLLDIMGPLIRTLQPASSYLAYIWSHDFY
jgi:hypothetical protein